MILPLLLPLFLGLQAPAREPQPEPAVQAPAALPRVRAQYSWGYVGADGQGKGTLNVLIDPVSGRTVLELQGLGERLVLLEGSSAEGFHLLIPRQKIDQRAPTLTGLPLPFLPQLGNPAGLYRLIREGSGPGVKVSKRDTDGPIKLRYDGKDDRGREVTVWLSRTRWEPEPAK
jgi:hypothetical protein